MANLFLVQKAPLHRRWHAVLIENGIELWQDQCDNMYAKALYTAAIWRAVHSTVIKTRLLPEMRRLKAANSDTECNALNPTERALAGVEQDLVQRTD